MINDKDIIVTTLNSMNKVLEHLLKSVRKLEEDANADRKRIAQLEMITKSILTKPFVEEQHPPKRFRDIGNAE
jgi:hypothetical protein